MKKIVCLLLSLILLLTLFIFPGCDTNGELSSESDQPTKTTVSAVCKEEKMNIYRAIAQETGCNPVIESTYNKEHQVYNNVKLNAYYAAGFKYYTLSEEEYENIQDYQNRTGIQIIYPLVKPQDRPEPEKYKWDANIFYKINESKSGIVPMLDDDGKFIPNYWMYDVDSVKSSTICDYNSIRIEGESGVNIYGVNYYYVYGRKKMGGIEVRMFACKYYEYMKATRPDDMPSEERFFGWYN